MGCLPTALQAISLSENNRRLQTTISSGELQSVQGQGPLDPHKIRIVGAKNLQVSQLIPHTQLVVSLELVAMAGSADALKVFPSVWIASLQSPNQSRRHDMVHVAPGSCLFEIHSACLNLTLPTQSWHSPVPPSLPRWAAPRPLPIHAAPAYWPLLSTEARPAVEAFPVTIRTMTSINCLEHFCSSVSAIWTTHCTSLLPPGYHLRVQRKNHPAESRFSPQIVFLNIAGTAGQRHFTRSRADRKRILLKRFLIRLHYPLR